MTQQHRGRVLIVAGSDSGGGAGIQADIKTVTMLGGFAATAITALTAQNTLGVHGVYDVPAAFVEQQMRVVLQDIGADAIKTGMLHSPSVIEAILRVLDDLAPHVPLVVDPVMVAKGGARLLQPEAETALIERLIPRATVITPNLPEAEALIGRPIPGREAMPAAAQSLLSLRPKAVLLKGGHLADGEVLDLLQTPQGETAFTSARIESRHTHGTGCTLASAIATGLAFGKPLAQAVGEARDYVRQAMLSAPGFGQGHGPLDHGWPLKRKA